MDPDLSLIIPAYNEAGRIAPTLKRINNYLTGSSFTSEILVVLDGRTQPRSLSEVMKRRLSGLQAFLRFFYPARRSNILPETVEAQAK